MGAAGRAAVVAAARAFRKARLVEKAVARGAAAAARMRHKVDFMCSSAVDRLLYAFIREGDGTRLLTEEVQANNQ